ncbi:protein FAM149A isoform X2 [Pangasianodon hypophthalmus]|uniref:protein FAM149A isoform X2 n=1 Tax=Pangasianodon hypophthalmus TaxID=310915 RepID=UPI002306F6FF|nr:protein FAM149A isoform X2 [Pangasianodon hypophthalmus]
MQVTVENISAPRCASIASKCFGSLARSSGSNLEKHQSHLSRKFPGKKMRKEPDTVNSSQDISLRKKLLREPNKYSCSGPVQLTRSANRGLSNDQSDSVCSQSSTGDCSPASLLTTCSCSAGYATGFSTEHSSIYSWRYDEFDQENTQHVRQLFSALDELLYEGKVCSKSESLRKECEEWNTHSPHLRILGNQLEPPKQEGIQYVHWRATSTRTAASLACLDTRDNHSELCVEGHRLAPGSWSGQSVHSGLPISELSCTLIPQEEEIYEVEGRIEEFLAYDGRETDNEGMDQRKASAIASWDGIPRMSPNACIRGAVADELFDDVWREVVCLLEDLLRKHWEKQHSDGATQRWTLESSSQIVCETSSHLPSRGSHISPSRGPNSRSMFLWPNTYHGQDSNVFKTNLNGVMTIQAKPLQQRQQGYGERSLCDSDDGSTILTTLKTPSGMSTHSHKPSGQRILPRLSGRALLRHNFPAQSSLRGTRLSTVAEDLLTPPVSAVQNHRLPLIHSDCAEQDCNIPALRHTQLRGRIMRGGAVHTVSSLPPLKEPTLLLESLSRPNTNHTFRSETPMKSSYTAMDFAFSMKTGRSLFTGNFSKTGDGTPMGVTGFSMGITSSTANGFSDCATPPKRRTHLLSSSDGEGGNITVLGSLGARKALSRFPIHGRKKFHVVMPQHT